MSPILGIWASAIQPSLANSYQSIATVTVGAGGASSIDFTSIPSTYKHLQIRGISRDNRATLVQNNAFMQFNGDTGSNYSYHLLTGDGATASTDAGASQVFNVGGTNAASGATASVFGVSVVDILDYTNTNKYKTTRTLTGNDNNGSGVIRLWSGLWMNTNAITSIKLYPSSSATFNQYSTFALYGIKG